MAKKTVLICDKCGAANATAVTITISAGRPWRIDLCDDDMAPLVELAQSGAEVPPQRKERFVVRATVAPADTTAPKRKIRLGPPERPQDAP